MIEEDLVVNRRTRPARGLEAEAELAALDRLDRANGLGEAMMAIVLAGAFLEKFGGDGLEEIRRNYETYLASLKPW